MGNRRGKRANRRSIRWQQALSDLTSDCHLLWRNNSFLWALLTTCVCQQQGKLTQAVLCVPGGENWQKERSSSGSGKNHSHTCYAVIDSCHMSIPALTAWEQWVRLSRQQRAAEGFRAARPLRGRSQRTVHMSPHFIFDLKLLNEPRCLCYDGFTSE